MAVCIVKDLSRFGRNSALTGMYANITFVKHGVRFIAINDNYDTIDPNSVDNDFAGIRNWFNEFYARDTSRKIRAVNKAKGGALTTNIPYGYKKGPDTPKGWLVDEEAARVVKRIFILCMEGRGPMQIAKALTEKRVLTPTAYKLRQGHKTPDKEGAAPCCWHPTTVVKFWSSGSTRAAPSISRPTPIPSGTRAAAKGGRISTSFMIWWALSR